MICKVDVSIYFCFLNVCMFEVTQCSYVTMFPTKLNKLNKHIDKSRSPIYRVIRFFSLALSLTHSLSVSLCLLLSFSRSLSYTLTLCLTLSIALFLSLFLLHTHSLSHSVYCY